MPWEFEPPAFVHQTTNTHTTNLWEAEVGFPLASGKKRPDASERHWDWAELELGVTKATQVKERQSLAESCIIAQNWYRIAFPSPNSRFKAPTA